MAHTLSTGDGTKTVYMRFKDSLGNSSADSTDTITLDTTLPTLTFTGSTPASGAIAGALATGQLDIGELNLGQFIRFQSGIRYPIYDSGLVLMYNFDNISALGESAGSVVKDMSQYNNTGTVYASTARISTGKRNGAFHFNGTTDYIGAQTRILGNNATFVARAKTDVYITDYRMLWNHPSDGRPTYYDLLFKDNRIYLNDGDGTGNPFSGGGAYVTQPSTGQWHHYVTVADATANKAYLYIDGTYAGEA
jgi:hypothetical protein